MDTMTISGDQFRKVLVDVETLVEDVTSLVNQDVIVRKRIAEIKANPSIGKSEEELDEYLKKRGIEIE